MRRDAYLNGQNFNNYLLTPDEMEFTEYGNPIVQPILRQELPWRFDLVPFNYVTTGKYKHRTVHFFIQDYMFDRVWNNPTKYIKMLLQQEAVIGPDFSLFRDTPEPIQRWSHYKRQWLSAYWQLQGIKVIPNVRWSSKESFNYCLDGVPHESVVCVSAVGAMVDKVATKLFLYGYERMQAELKPKHILIRSTQKAMKELACHTNVPFSFLENRFRDYTGVKNG